MIGKAASGRHHPPRRQDDLRVADATVPSCACAAQGLWARACTHVRAGFAPDATLVRPGRIAVWTRGAVTRLFHTKVQDKPEAEAARLYRQPARAYRADVDIYN